MKKLLCALIAALMLALCAAGHAEEAAIADGLYSVQAESNSKMFNVTSCMLRVRGGEMTAILSLHGTSYRYVYPGTAVEAEAAPQSDWAGFAVGADGYYCYEFPLASLEGEQPVAAWSMKSEKWYDRTLSFDLDSLRPCDRIAPDGRYAAAAELDGEAVECVVVIRDGEMTAALELPGCEAVCLGAPDAAQAGEEPFEFALPSLDRAVEISALAGGEWTSRELYVPAASLAPSANVPEDGVYSIDCKSDSGLFKITGCTLTVEGGAMRAELRVQKDSYDCVYPGSSADALRAPESERIPIEAAEEGWTYVVPVESLDGETLISTWSESRKAWYERSLTFDPESLSPIA